MTSPQDAIRELSKLMPFDFAETTKRIRDMQHEQHQAWEAAVQQAKPYFAALKKYVRSRLKLGKGQWITFRGTGIVSIYKNGHRGIESVACVDAEIHTGVHGAVISLKWMPEDLGDLDRRLAALRNALAAIRME